MGCGCSFSFPEEHDIIDAFPVAFMERSIRGYSLDAGKVATSIGVNLDVWAVYCLSDMVLLSFGGIELAHAKLKAQVSFVEASDFNSLAPFHQFFILLGLVIRGDYVHRAVPTIADMLRGFYSAMGFSFAGKSRSELYQSVYRPMAGSMEASTDSYTHMGTDLYGDDAINLYFLELFANRERILALSDSAAGGIGTELSQQECAALGRPLLRFVEDPASYAAVFGAGLPSPLAAIEAARAVATV